MPRTFIDQKIDVFLGRNSAVVPTIGTDIQSADEPLSDVYVPALITLFPSVCRDLELDPLGCARLTFFLKPGHSRHRVTKRTICEANVTNASPAGLSYCPDSPYPDWRDSHATRSAIPTPIEHARRNDPP